ncbi:MAG: hypothetical protein IPI88_15145 [Chitinophagaceae bacterium]|nr:hypothetical protein [Chitinophagaceae bacterium]
MTKRYGRTNWFTGTGSAKNYPQLVKQNDKGELSVNYSGLVPVLLEGIKEQQKQMETLKQQLNEQRKMIEELRQK